MYADMVGDLFHVGHMQFLRSIKHRFPACKLIVGILSDSNVETYKRLPIMTMTERIQAAQECKYVDFVLADVPLVMTEEFMRLHDIDLVVHAHDITDTQYDEAYVVPMRLGKFLRCDYNHSMSTTELIRRIRCRTDL